MNSTAFNALDAARTLRAAGIERPQAEAIAHVVHHARADLVTKADLAAFEARTDGKFGSLESRLMAEIEKAKNVILRSVLAASVAVIVTLIGSVFTIISAG